VRFSQLAAFLEKVITLNRVGFIGLGKLGLPCAAALSVTAKIQVTGFDVNVKVAGYVSSASIPYQEDQCEDYLKKADIRVLDSLSSFLDETDIVFVAVQTPHEPQFEGSSPVPDSVQDFDYSYIRQIASEVRDYLLRPENTQRVLTLVVISTVLPGTMRSVVIPQLGPVLNRVKFCYNPFFIAMGTTIADYLNPEFILLGELVPGDGDEVIELYSKVHSAHVRRMQIESAELTKVAYNTFIGFKIVFANTLAEIVQTRGGNVDEVTQSLASADNRLISGKYLSAGMADGGGCHPRDQIAMSWLARDAGLSSDIFGFLAHARDAQTQRQADLVIQKSQEYQLPICLLGIAYKPDVNLSVGSPGLLLASFLEQKAVEYSVFDPYCLPDSSLPKVPHVFFVSTNHTSFKSINLPEGSVVVDPWESGVPEKDGFIFVKPGRMITQD
jgi:UDPglucose 6-dehydrogenase